MHSMNFIPLPACDVAGLTVLCKKLSFGLVTCLLLKVLLGLGCFHRRSEGNRENRDAQHQQQTAAGPGCQLFIQGGQH